MDAPVDGNDDGVDDDEMRVACCDASANDDCAEIGKLTRSSNPMKCDTCSGCWVEFSIGHFSTAIRVVGCNAAVE